jgi:hypothetical protein
MFIGNDRSGKSTRLNQIVSGDIKSSIPFRSSGGTKHVTIGFQFLGPIPISELVEVHKFYLSTESKLDIFLVDCEGLACLGESTPTLKRAMFALCQISSITVLVMKEMINVSNIEDVRSLFSIFNVFKGSIPGFKTGTVIMIRDIGLDLEGNENFNE